MREDDGCTGGRCLPPGRVMQTIRRMEWVAGRVNPLRNVTIRWGSYRFSEESETQKRFNIVPRVEKAGSWHATTCCQRPWSTFLSVSRP